MDATTYLPGADKNNSPGAPLNAYKKEYGEFIDLAAHELDAPLRKLSSFVEMLTTKFKTISSDAEIQQYVNRIDSCVNDMRLLVKDLTSLSRIVSDKREHSSFGLETIVQEVLMDMQPMMSESSAMLTMSELPVIEGDKQQYLRLFRNIIENAIKFKRKDINPAIHISTSRISDTEKVVYNIPDNEHYIKIVISDNGIGFKQEHAEKILLPFVRLHGKHQYGGNGLGLAICRKIVENHDGFLYAESTGNSGSSFVLIVPQTIGRSC